MKLKIGEKRTIIGVGDFFSAARLFFRPEFSAPAQLIGQRAGVKLKFSWCERILSKSVKKLAQILTVEAYLTSESQKNDVVL